VTNENEESPKEEEKSNVPHIAIAVGFVLLIGICILSEVFR
jgi:hypothetical protein